MVMDVTTDLTISSFDAGHMYEDAILLKDPIIQKHLADQTRRLSRDSDADIPLGAFSEWLARRKQSHFSYNHPCADMLEYAFRSCCNATQFLEGSAGEVIRKGMEFFACNEPFGDVAIPIARETLNLLGAVWQDGDGLFPYHSRKVTLADYIGDCLSYRRARLGIGCH